MKAKNLTIVFIVILLSNLNVNAQYDSSLNLILKADNDIKTFVNTATTIEIYASPISSNYIQRFEWDLNSDGLIDTTTIIPKLTYTYSTIGMFRIKITAYDNQGSSNSCSLNISVENGIGLPSKIPSQSSQSLPQVIRSGDGIVITYAILISGGPDNFFWPQAEAIYGILKNNYQIPLDRIYLLHWNGINPNGINPNGIIYNKATYQNIQNVFNLLSSSMDADDRIFIWVNAHGAGYGSDNIQKLYLRNVLSSKAYIDNTREKYCKESDYKLCYFYEGLSFGQQGAFGLNQWRMGFDKGILCRFRIVSHFDVTLQDGSHVMNNDVFLEKQIDYMLGYDFNHNGIPAYSSTNSNFDEGDWGAIDKIDPNIYNILSNGVAPGNEPTKYVLFDKDLNNTLDIDFDQTLGYIQSGHYEDLIADATDIDNDGIIVGVDANGNGTKDDWITVETNFQTYDDIYITDMNFANLVYSLPTNNIITIINSCYGGGFMYELSKKGQITISATEKDMLALANNGFTDYFNNAFSNPSLSDSNGDNKVSMVEAFKYSMQQIRLIQNPLYDDNGDGIGHTDLTTDNSDGCWGSFNTITTNLLTNTGLTNETITTDRAVQGNAITATNVVIDNNAKVQMNSPGDIIIGSGVEVKIGATLETNNTPCP